jgi:hypothetical protein
VSLPESIVLGRALMTLLGVIYAQGITHLFLEKVNHSSRKRKAGDTFVTTTVSIGTSNFLRKERGAIRETSWMFSIKKEC